MPRAADNRRRCRCFDLRPSLSGIARDSRFYSRFYWRFTVKLRGCGFHLVADESVTRSTFRRDPTRGA